MDYDLIIFRGLPGSGKSSIGKSYAKANGYVFIEPDSYITLEDGTYDYSPEKFKAAVSFAREDVSRALKAGERVVYSDVLPKLSDVTGLVGELRKEYSFTVIDITISMQTSFERNTHKVPYSEIRRLFYEWEYWYN